MKKILLCGHHPFAGTGNGNMMAAILGMIDRSKYDVACFAPDAPAYKVVFEPLDFTIIPAGSGDTEIQRLISLIASIDLDVLVMVGMDIWHYSQAFAAIDRARQFKKFKWVSIFPYDAQDLRTDWLSMMKYMDIPCVYSKYGLEILKDALPNVRYFRPPLLTAEMFEPKDGCRAKVFNTVPEDHVIFGFVGKNQFRKDPQKLIRAFYEAHKENPKITLYLHTELDGKYNLKQYAQDCGFRTNMMIAKQQGRSYSREQMVEIYNAIDCLVNCTIQEGLSWTPLEAMLCGTPVIASRTTSQTELVEHAGRLVPATETAYIPTMTKTGESYIEGKACSIKDIKDAILEVAGDPDLREKMRADGLERGRQWLEGVSDINEVLADCLAPVKTVRKIKKILFAQHSSAGDILMTTQCFKGIKKRHPEMPLVYMTQKRFQGIVEGNPYVDEIIDWDERLLGQYEIVYNPHGEHILHGGFNNLDVTLFSMYPYFCKVEPDDLFIEPSAPRHLDLPDEYIVVHTSGGDKQYRTYPHMDVVIRGFDIPVVQLGGADDLRCRSDLDLRGRLTWRESAWVMRKAKAAVVVDSFLSHLAGAVGTNAVVLYGPAPPRVVRPKAQGCEIKNLKPDMLDVCRSMTHCWGRLRQCNSPCIATISPLTIRKALEELLR